MKLTRDNFGVLLTPVHTKIFQNKYNEKTPQYTQVFKVDNMNRQTQTYPHLGGFGLWDANTEGNTINEDSMSQGNTASFTAQRFDKGYELTWELTKDDLYNVMKGMGKGGSAGALGRGLRATEETQSASILNGGFVNTGYDGVSLFNHSHPLIDSANVLDNYLTGKLSDPNLKAGLIMMRNQVDEAGVKIQAIAKNLIVHPNNEYNANALVKSSGPAGELSNDTNTLPSLKVVVMDYLTNGDAWYLQDPSIDNLLFLWREKPIFDSQAIPKTMDFFMFGYARWTQGYVDCRGLVGSDGTTAA